MESAKALLARILQFSEVFADKPGEQNYSAEFPAKHPTPLNPCGRDCPFPWFYKEEGQVAEQALCAQFLQGFTPREARPNYVRGKFPTETFGLEDSRTG